MAALLPVISSIIAGIKLSQNGNDSETTQEELAEVVKRMLREQGVPRYKRWRPFRKLLLRDLLQDEKIGYQLVIELAKIRTIRLVT